MSCNEELLENHGDLALYVLMSLVLVVASGDSGCACGWICRRQRVSKESSGGSRNLSGARRSPRRVLCRSLPSKLFCSGSHVRICTRCRRQQDLRRGVPRGGT